ncbi:MAG: IS630 family transposase [Ectobacillus sp.]
MIFLYEDETHIRDYQALHATWAPVGQQKKVQTQGHHAKLTLFGAVNAHNGEVLCMESTKCDAASFLQFLQYVLEQHKNRYVIMALDNARIHHAKLIQPFLKENRERLMLLFLPPYSPNLNLLERIWKWLKECVIANRYHATQADIRASVLSFLEHLASFPEKVLQRMGRAQMLKD